MIADRMKIRRPEKLTAREMTPGRIVGAASRMRLAFARACGLSDAFLGEHSAAWDTLRRRIDALAAVCVVDSSATASGVFVSRVMLELAHVRPHAERAHDLATRLLAVAASIEAEDATAAAVAAELAWIVANAAMILESLDENGAKIAA